MGKTGSISGRDSHHHGYPTKLVLGQRASWRGVEPESRVSKRKEEVNSEGFTGQYISTNETTHRIIHGLHKATGGPQSRPQPLGGSAQQVLTPPLPLALDPAAAHSKVRPAQNQGHHTQPKPHSRHWPAPGPRREGWSLAKGSEAGSVAGGPGLGCSPDPP